MYICALCTHLGAQGVGAHRTVVTDDWEPPCVDLKPNLGPSGRAARSPIAEPSFHPLVFVSTSHSVAQVGLELE